MVDARILKGLPVYGEMPLSFPKPNAFREGLVVEFSPDRGGRWVGNFESGPTNGVNSVHGEFGPSYVYVFSGGAGYVVDIGSRNLVAELNFGFLWVEFVEECGILLACNDLWFEAFAGSQRKWQSPRLSWDGMRNIRRSGAKVTAETYHIDGSWHPVTLDVATGKVVGGSYDGPGDF